MKGRIIGAWVCSTASLVFLLISDPGGIITYGWGPYDIISFIVAGVGSGLGWSTWRPTEKSTVGLVGGIFGSLVALSYLALMILHFIDIASSF